MICYMTVIYAAIADFFIIDMKYGLIEFLGCVIIMATNVLVTIYNHNLAKHH